MPLAITLNLPWPVFVYAAASVVTFSLYAVDKTRARAGRWRIRESTLHAAALLGGFPGAYLAQRLLRHKNRKPGFQLIFWIIVGLHVGFWAWWVAFRPGGG